MRTRISVQIESSDAVSVQEIWVPLFGSLVFYTELLLLVTYQFMPPWMQGAPYDYGAALRAGWYPLPMTPYPPFYPPTMHPPYHGSYAEGAPQANYNAQPAAINHGPDYYLGGIRGGYGTSTSLGQSASLPDVAAASTNLDVPVPNAPRLGSRALSESPLE